jgi:hypothetical protein
LYGGVQSAQKKKKNNKAGAIWGKIHSGSGVLKELTNASLKFCKVNSYLRFVHIHDER